MRILALDTSRSPGSVALLEGTSLIDEASVPEEGRTTKQLFPLLRSLLASAQWSPRDVELLAVTLGPGSFTGLRIGITLAKVWAYACQCPVVALDTLDVLAAQSEADAQSLEVVLHAERHQLFHARFVRHPLADSTSCTASASSLSVTSINNDSAGAVPPGTASSTWHRVTPTRILQQSEWIAQLAPGTAVLGDGLAKLSGDLPAGIILEEPHCWTLRASTLGQLAQPALERGEQVDFWTLLPQYCRPSAAEEKRLAAEPSR